MHPDLFSTFVDIGGDMGPDAGTNDQTDAANALCKLGRANGIACAVVTQPGRHDWPLAADVFTTSLAGTPVQAATH